MSIYLAGYSGHTPAQLLSAATSLKARVLDIRLYAASQIPGWSKDALRATLGSRYVPVPELGNAARRDGGEMRLDQPSIGLDVVMMYEALGPVILLCGCADARNCHRTMVGDLLRADGYDVQELAWPAREGAVGTVKALSLWQPWASLMAIGAKRIETRSWATSYRGPLVNQAAKRFQSDEKGLCLEEPFRSALNAAGLLPTERERGVYHPDPNYISPCAMEFLPLGMALSVYDLVDCVLVEEIRDSLSEQERAFGNYSDGRFAWKTENMRAFPQPLPMKGAQQIFSVEFDVEAALRGLVEVL